MSRDALRCGAPTGAGTPCKKPGQPCHLSGHQAWWEQSRGGATSKAASASSVHPVSMAELTATIRRLDLVEDKKTIVASAGKNSSAFRKAASAAVSRPHGSGSAPRVHMRNRSDLSQKDKRRLNDYLRLARELLHDDEMHEDEARKMLEKRGKRTAEVGGCGKVIIMKDHEGDTVAVKTPIPTERQAESEVLELFERELVCNLALMLMSDDDNVVCPTAIVYHWHRGILKIKGQEYLGVLTMEPMKENYLQHWQHPDRTLRKVSKRVIAPRVKARMRHIHQLLDAVQYMHLCGIAHADLHLKNVMVAADGTVRLVDLGNSLGAAQVTTSFISSCDAPELSRLKNSGADIDVLDFARVDVWCLGALMMEMLLEELHLNVLADRVDVRAVLRQRLPVAKADLVFELIQDALQEEPKKRPSAMEMCHQIERAFPYVTQQEEAVDEEDED